MTPEWAAVIVAAIVGVVGVAFKVDVAALLDRRNESRRAKLKAICPHVRLHRSKEGMTAESLIISPAGSLTWVCKLCGGQTFAPGNDQVYWITRPREWERAFARAVKLRAKLRANP